MNKLDYHQSLEEYYRKQKIKYFLYYTPQTLKKIWIPYVLVDKEDIPIIIAGNTTGRVLRKKDSGEMLIFVSQFDSFKELTIIAKYKEGRALQIV